MSRTRLQVPSRVGDLTPLHFVPKGEKPAHWVCLCDCGRECTSSTNGLVYGTRKSCGCKKYAAVAAGLSKALRKHGHSQADSPAYRCWKNIHVRCNNPKADRYPRYGGRGIKVCQRWDNFEHFLADMGAHPGKGYSIERRDVDGDYEPTNCYWATSAQQSRNRTDNHLLTFEGKTLCLTDWAAIKQLTRSALKTRLAHGWSVEEALTTPLGSNGRGVSLTSASGESTQEPPRQEHCAAETPGTSQ